MKKIIFELLFKLGAGVLLKELKVHNKEVTVLMFHRISDDPDFLWPPMPIKSFETLVKLLVKKTRIIKFDELNKISEYPDKPLFIISFDDGYEDFYTNALPVLLKYKIPANLNICPGLIEKNTLPWTQTLNYFIQAQAGHKLLLPEKREILIPEKPDEFFFNKICSIFYTMEDKEREEFINDQLAKSNINLKAKLLSWDKLKLCAENGIHIGSHSMNHLNLAKTTNNSVLEYEIKQSKKLIKEKIGVTPEVFAFPNGLYNNESLNLVIDNYKFTLLCDGKPNVFNSNKAPSIFSRVNISKANYKEEYLRSLGLHQFVKNIKK